MWEIAGLILLILCCVIGVLITALRLPGTWVIVAGAAVFGWWCDWTRVSLTLLVILIGIGLAGEAIELLASMFTARRAGASRRAAWGGLTGGIVGMFLFSLPVPVVGTIVGALLGCFAGAMVAELSVRKKLAQGAKVGFFSAAGFALGAVAKLAVAMVMAGVLVTSAVCSSSITPPGPESTQPIESSAAP
ncbi:MAG: DUF456 domain-containing protein [Phycisphaerales bacterium]|nr:MAG: DUF456 domain-containing protein [Phycisphaerales bacterium]